MKLEGFSERPSCRFAEPPPPSRVPSASRCQACACHACLITRHDICFGIPDHPQLQAVQALVRRMYLQSGIRPPVGADAVAGAGHSTLAAWQAGCPVGTLALRADSAHGLLAEEIYPREIAGLRGSGGQLFEITRLAVLPGPSARLVLSTLFHLLCLFVHHAWAASDVVIEVHPRHANLYCRLGGFRAIGELRTCRRVNAPAVLLHARLETLQSRIAEYRGNAGPGPRTHLAHGMHRHLLSQAEQAAVQHRLRHL